jgi:hypothetical protein
LSLAKIRASIWGIKSERSIVQFENLEIWKFGN